MPLTAKGKEIETVMQKQYGEKEGERVFYASKNAGTISGVDSATAADARSTSHVKMDFGGLNEITGSISVASLKEKIKKLPDNILYNASGSFSVHPNIRKFVDAELAARKGRKDEAAPSLNAVIDSMSEQLNSIGQAAKGIVERFAPRADAVDRRQIEKLIDELKAAGSAPRIKYDNEGRIELIDGLDPISFYERNKGSTAFEPGRRK